MELLGGDVMQIKEQLISLGHPNRKGEKIKPIAVVIHYTGNDAPTATDTANVNYVGRKYIFKNGIYYEADGITEFRYGSAHWFIDQDSATLAIPQNEVAWGCGDRSLPYNNGYKGQTKIAKDIFNHKQNYLVINYEICNNDVIKNSDEDWKNACNNAIEIIVKDMINYNISTDMIFRHYDITGKICPAPFVKDEKSWIDFKNKIINKVNLYKNGGDVLTMESLFCKKIVKVNTLLNVRQSPTTDSLILGQLKNNEIVKVTGKLNEWYRINYNGQDGFVHGGYLENYFELDYQQENKRLTEENISLKTKLEKVIKIINE
jgi:N-acetylmuramoyl-L-alanine amidase CwlA